MWKGTGVTAGFAIASTLGLILGFFVPPLLPFAVLGTFLGFLPALFTWGRRGLRTSRGLHLRRSQAAGLAVLAAVAALAAVVAGVWGLVSHQSHPRPLFRLESPLHRPPPLHAENGRGSRGAPANTETSPARSRPRKVRRITMGVKYTGEAVHRDDPERLQVTDRLWMSNAALKGAPADLHALTRADPRVGASIRWEQRWLGAHGLLRAMVRGLTARHWHLSEEDTEGISFERGRRVPIHSRTFPPETGNTIALPQVAIRDNRDGIPIKLRFSPASRLTLIATPETFGPSFPTGMRRTRPVSDLEEIVLPMTETGQVEVDVRSPLFRNELLGGFADVSIFAVIHWGLGLLLTALILLFNEEFRTRVQRLWRPRAQTAAAG